MPALACPSADQLRRLAAGLLPNEEAQSLENHVLSCPACVNRLAALESAGPARAESSAIFAFLSQEAHVLDRLLSNALGAETDTSALQREAATSDTADNRAAAAGDPELPEILALFDPPQQPGYLGSFAGYRVVRLLGAGGMGLVFEAEDPRLRRTVALKLLRPRMARVPGTRARLLREAQAGAALQNDHVVSVFDAGEHKSIPFLTMPLLSGKTLDRRLADGAKYDSAGALALARQIALGLAAAHDAGLVHRDLKPANVWIERGSDRAKILDFGIAFSTGEPNLTQEGTIVGTVAYMAPEQAQGLGVDARSDLYSLGCIVYQLLAGKAPYEGSTPQAVLAKLVTSTPQPLQRLNDGIPSSVSRFVERLMARDPADRPVSARQVADEIDEIARELSAVPTEPPGLAETSLLPGAARRQGDEANSPSDGRPGDLTAAASSRRGPRRMLLIASAAAAALVVLAGVVVVIKNRHGEEVGRLNVADGNSATIEQDDGKTAQPAPPPIVTESAAALPDQPVPFVLVRGDGQRRAFKTFDQALAVLQQGAEIDVHGNGPFRIPRFTLTDRDLVIRAAPGYRPRFEPASEGPPPAAWIEARSVNVRLDGCDWVGFGCPLLTDADSEGQREWEIRNCRFSDTAPIQFYFGAKLVIADCLLQPPEIAGGLVALVRLGPKSRLEFHNNIVRDGQIYFEAGGQTATLTDNTFSNQGWTIAGPFDGQPPAEIVAERNIFESAPVFVVHSASKISRSQELKEHVLWRGRDNLYHIAYPDRAGRAPFGTYGFFFGPNEGVGEFFAPNFEQWKRFWGETGSRAAQPRFAHHELCYAQPETVIDRLRTEARALRKKHGAAFVECGPNWDALGPGAAYSRAQAGVAVEAERNPPETGGLALVRAGRTIRGFPTITSAIAEAEDGDILEFHTDGPLDGCTIPQRSGAQDSGQRLTLRAAPGYRPVLRGPIVGSGATRLALAGLHFVGGAVRGPFAELRIDYCSATLADAPSSPMVSVEFGATDQSSPPVVIRNSVLPGVIRVQARDKRNSPDAIIEDSIVGPLSLVAWGGGDLNVHLARTAVRPPAIHPCLVVEGGTASVHAEANWFASTDNLVSARPWGGTLAGWSGSRNCYQLARRTWLAWEQVTGLESWRERFDSSDEGSSWIENALSDPRTWKLLEGSPGNWAGPEGSDLGASVDRVARTTDSPASEPGSVDEDRSTR